MTKTTLQKIIVFQLLTLATFCWADDDVTSPQEEVSPPSHQECRIEVQVNSRLNVRRGPWGEICNKYVDGQLVDVTGGSGDWLRIRGCDGVAYVHRVGFSAEDWSQVTSGAQCSFDSTEPSGEDPAPAPEGSSVGWNGNSEYQSIAMSEVTEHGLDQLNPSDINAYCPNYSGFNSQQRREFWSTFLYAMSIPESGTRPHLTHTESFSASCTLSGGNRISGRVVSTGLVQVSACSCRGYGEPVHSLETLKDPRSNLSCAARILRRQVGRHGVIRGRSGSSWRGASSYWSVVRNTAKNRQIQNTIRRTYSPCY